MNKHELQGILQQESGRYGNAYWNILEDKERKRPELFQFPTSIDSYLHLFEGKHVKITIEEIEENE